MFKIKLSALLILPAIIISLCSSSISADISSAGTLSAKMPSLGDLSARVAFSSINPQETGSEKIEESGRPSDNDIKYYLRFAKAPEINDPIGKPAPEINDKITKQVGPTESSQQKILSEKAPDFKQKK